MCQQATENIKHLLAVLQEMKTGFENHLFSAASSIAFDMNNSKAT
jgi:hypothetical protein